jgi:hypothetical protein
MRRALYSIAATFAAFALTGCASMSVSSHVERAIDFGQYRTYDWGPADALPTGDPRLDQNPFFKDHIQGAVERQLAARGFQRVAAGMTPDLLIHYHANISQRIDVDRVDRDLGYCAEGCAPPVTEYEAGTLVLDIVETRTNRVIWRGWAQDTVEDALDNPDEMERQINEGVTRMLAQLPRPF